MAEPSNPFSSFVSDFASSIMGKSISSSSTNPAIDTQITELLPDQLSSWKLIREDLSSKQSTEEERHFRANLEYGYGPASPLHKIRLYSPDNSKEDVRVTFYRDSASWYVRHSTKKSHSIFYFDLISILYNAFLPNSIIQYLQVSILSKSLDDIGTKTNSVQD